MQQDSFEREMVSCQSSCERDVRNVLTTISLWQVGPHCASSELDQDGSNLAGMPGASSWTSRIEPNAEVPETDYRGSAGGRWRLEAPAMSVLFRNDLARCATPGMRTVGE